MAASTPEQVYEELAAGFAAGDLERLMALYEPGAALVAQPGEPVVGTEQVRAALGGFLALKPTFACEVREITYAGDLALVTGQWSLHGTGPDGSAVTFSSVSADVMRRQADGTWRWVIDQPWGTQLTAE
jgi:uncharacterized protein (TIGR02246 family)